MKKNILMPVLAVLLCAALLVGANTALAGVRQAKTAEELNQLMLTMLPGSTGFTPEEYSGEDASIRAVYKDPVGYVLHVVTAGYVGDISMLVAVRKDEVFRLRKTVFDIDPDAFLMMLTTDEVRGLGFMHPHED